ncbi:YbdD/YjiX family protein [Sphingomonas sp. Leaf10]|uniref:YbdD/YjiX family protein n=1 Tax=Sphingomonas sp. Leaf10 TaxID=1735676 RepID=UPI0006FACAD7|nr:YbdD/YjiX family protein [Sphingomonas sp. Leaf10]KQM37771.1 hypothetical protein ASE59_13740 [Sphingomonas sp. Leaf10]
MRFLRKLAEGARLMVGIPDYDRYVAHRVAHHPHEPVMSVKEFHRDRIARRYGTGPGAPPRCC